MNYICRQECINDQEVTLAPVKSRIFAIIADLFVVFLIILVFTIVLSKLFKLDTANFKWNGFEEYELQAENISKTLMHAINVSMGLLPFIYFSLVTFTTNGRTIGKIIFGIKVMGIYHHRLNIWHCIERSLGYVASTAEAGLGFIQVLWNPNRMALHDKIAETIVVMNRKKKK